MTLMTRVARLFRADLHALLDRVEEPEALLRQALREMDEALAEDRRRLQAMTRDQARLATREAESASTLARLDGELDLCFGAGNDELARTLVKRKLEAQRLAQLLARRRSTLDDARGALRDAVDEQQARLEALRQKADLLTEERARADDEPWPAEPDAAIRDADVEVAWLRERQQRRATP